MQQATLLHVRNPVTPAIGARRFDVMPGLTLTQALAESEWKLPCATVLYRDGKLVKRSEWDDIPIIEGEIVGLVTLPQNGGGGQGGGGSQVLTAIALIALMVVAWYAAPLLAPGIVGLLGVTTSVATSIAAGAIMIAGQLLLSVLLPPPSQKQTPTAIQAYNLSPQSNVARIGQPVPERGGQECTYCDLAAAPYTEYDESDRQYVFQRFVVGQGSFNFHQLRVADTVIWEDGAYVGNYPSLEIQLRGLSEEHTLVPECALMSVEVESLKLVGTDESGYDWSGTFITNPPRTTATAIAIDFGFPAGLYRTDSDGAVDVDFQFQAQQIDDIGNVLGDWFDIVVESFNHRLFNPIRRSRKVNLVTPGRYQVQGRRTNAHGGTQFNSDLYWIGLRAYFTDVTSYAGVTTIGFKARSTSGLNGTTAQLFNVIATRRLQTYDLDTGTWNAIAPTRSIAAMASNIMRSPNGMNLPDSRIDLETLWQLDDTWTTRGDTFDGTFDQRKSAWECLQDVLGCGRTRPIMAGPKITFMRDEPRTGLATAFTPAQMVPNSFSVQYLFHDSQPTDAVLAIFLDERTWRQNQVLCALPDSTLTEDNAPQLQVFGMVNRTQVWNETITRVAASFYRRIFPSFQTEMDGRVLIFGSPVKLSHHIASWGASALATKYLQSDDLLVLSEPWQPTEDPPYMLCMTTPDGRVFGPVTIDLIDAGADNNRAIVRLTGTMDPGGKYAGMHPRDWPIWSGDGLQFERPKVMLGTVDEAPIDALVVSMTPQSGMKTQLVTVADDPRVYEADADGPPDEGGGGGGGGGDEDLTITAITITEFELDDGELIFNVLIAGAPDAVSFNVKVNYNEAGYGGIISESRLFQLPAAGITSVQVMAQGKATTLGDWFESDEFHV